MKEGRLEVESMTCGLSYRFLYFIFSLTNNKTLIHLKNTINPSKSPFRESNPIYYPCLVPSRRRKRNFNPKFGT